MREKASRTGLIAGLLLATAGAAAAYIWLRPAAPPEVPTPVAETAISEVDALAASHGLARRDGGTLFFLQQSGEILALTDHLQCGDIACPKELATSYRYLGWNEAIGGYRLAVGIGQQREMVLSYADDEPVLIDARHAAEAREPLAMPAVAPPAANTDPSLAEWLADLTNDREQGEQSPLKAHADQVSRDGAALSLAFGDHRHLILQDDLVCGQLACPPQISRSFDYVGESPDGQFHVVHVEGNETEQGLLIDRQGTVLVTLGVPSFSPDGKFAVAALSDLEAAAPRRLEVWGLKDGKAGLIFSVQAKEEDDTVYEVVGWADANHLRLKRGGWGSDQRTAVMLVRDASGWHIEEGDIGN